MVSFERLMQLWCFPKFFFHIFFLSLVSEILSKWIVFPLLPWSFLWNSKSSILRELLSSDSFSSSPFLCYGNLKTVFPVEFCAENGIPLSPPRGWNKERFDWVEYLEETGATPAPRWMFADEFNVSTITYICSSQFHSYCFMFLNLLSVRTCSRKKNCGFGEISFMSNLIENSFSEFPFKFQLFFF